MSPPSDGARPVYLVDTGRRDESGQYEVHHVSHDGPIPMADNWRLYTAADYDALRAEVERLREELREALTDLSLTRTNILIELNQGRERWDGVPDHLRARIESISAALTD